MSMANSGVPMPEYAVDMLRRSSASGMRPNMAPARFPTRRGQPCASVALANGGSAGSTDSVAVENILRILRPRK